MELSDRYVYHVFTTKNFTKSANLLYISQPSLSAAISAKEKELGFQIFDRSTRPISLTPKGSIYIEMLERVMNCESDMLNSLRELDKPSTKKIIVSSGIYLSHYILPTVCGAFLRRYPDIAVDIDLNSKSQPTFFQKLDNEMLDIHFSYSYDAKKHNVYTILTERIIVAMHKCFLTPELRQYALTHNEVLSESYSAQKEVTDTTIFRDVPFLETNKKAITIRYMDAILSHYTPSQYSISNVSHIGLHLNMMCAGTGALFISDALTKVSNACYDDIVFFAFPKEISIRKLYALLKKGKRIEAPVENFLELTKEICATDKYCSLYYE